MTERNPVAVATWDRLEDRKPAYGLVANVDLVIVRYDDAVSVLYGRCLDCGALMADGQVVGDDLICGVHGWDYRYDTWVSSYNPAEVLHKFTSWIDEGTVWLDRNEIIAWHDTTPQAKKPLRLQIPLFVSDMSFGALSEEATVALATGAHLAGTGICSGEGG